jgi:tetratricopeptide (TPR) repeat protein
MYKALILLLLSLQIYAQTTKQKLVGEWVKDDITLSDNSPILKDDIRNLQLRYTFMKNDSFQITINGKTGKGTYKLLNDTLSIAGSVFKVEYLDDVKLTIQSISPDPSTQSKALKLTFLPVRFHNLGFTPITYRTQGQDTIFVSKHDYLEPLFLDTERSAAQFISENFYFPDYKKGDFYARFIITKKGEIKGIDILNSTHEKYNKYLIKAIKSSAGKWQPAHWEGKVVNSEVKMGFDMGWSDKKEDVVEKDTIDTETSNFYLLQGNICVEEKRYAAAIKNLNKSLEADPLNIDAYYARAATYALTSDKKKMCGDLLQLKNLQQAKGTDLWNKFCQDKK